MNLIKKIETYKQMALEMKDIVPDAFDCNFRISDVSIEDIHMLSDKYGVTIEHASSLSMVYLSLQFEHCRITCFSVRCEIKTSVDILPISDLQKQVA